ncbi:isopentenyl-diphosphate-delta-isomerase II [Encephalitozoon romaleae SJ-2008]|uniref:isopentenyl-diphosphate Delta-isomerase n=1 Tax=Encephalitozoon romaleae (strain SJ-2008) TaxID=1178016 RepID=I7ALE1_ENCRO|nr:isopentenyl-diphosphate-delta-isomerase II [Encephalitozoon romaleae SJ-2008]AFN82489.1 isopentenyl-diphosphate-delta-isomerase II [Encephalitozoon romaleae SJ-2008]
MDNYNRNILLVNDKDKVVGIGKALRTHFREHLMLHRAFSVFLFNSRNELLIQKRASGKLLFPNKWTNSVCSHPFVNDLSFINPLLDVKIHAVKRIDHELGIGSILIDDLRFVSRIIYKASPTERYSRILPGIPTTQKISTFPDPNNLSGSYSSDDFHEWEVDYIILAVSDASPCPNPNEVSEIRYVCKEELQELIARDLASPWLDEISKHVDIFDIKQSYFPSDP